MKIEYTKLLEARELIFGILGKSNESELRTKLEHFVMKWNENVSKELSAVEIKYQKLFQSKKEDLEILHASEKDGFLIKIDGQLVHTKENMLTIRKSLSEYKDQLNEELQKEVLDIDLYLIEDPTIINKFDTN